MGEAKRRGTCEQRKAEGVIKREQRDREREEVWYAKVRSRRTPREVAVLAALGFVLQEGE